MMVPGEELVIFVRFIKEVNKVLVAVVAAAPTVAVATAIRVDGGVIVYLIPANELPVVDQMTSQSRN